MAHLIRVMGVSERFACRVTGQNRATQRREPTGTTTADPDAALRVWLRRYAKDHPKRGFRPAYHDARAEGWNVNRKKIQRLCARKGCACLTGDDVNAPARAQRPTGRKADARIRSGPSTSSSTPAPTDDRSRLCPSSKNTPANVSAAWSNARSPPTGSSTNWTASPPCVDTPAVLRCDNGPELACEAMADWAGERVGLSFIPPGEPWRNGYVESFSSRVRDECLNINIFWSLTQARVVITDWKEDYNHRRRHSSLGYQAPADYAAACTHR